MIQWYKDEIELAELRSTLSRLQRDATVNEAERIQAIAAIAQMTQQPEGEEAEAPSKPRTLKREPESV
jgi:hypothetical protein